MPTRTVTQVQVFSLLLNDMRSPKIEMCEVAAVSEREGALEELMDRERVSPYRDGQWGKVFRPGGPLEWFNPPVLYTGREGVRSEWVEQEQWEELKDRFNLIP